MSAARWFSMVVWLGSLGGCGGDHDFSDLDAYMQELRLRPLAQVEAVPGFRPYAAFNYSAEALRSPFSLPIREGPASSRDGQRFEGFNVELFEMVGTISNASGAFVLLRDADAVHRFKVGDYLGRNNGRIMVIRATQVEVLEIVPDGEGDWRERTRTLSLKERS